MSERVGVPQATSDLHDWLSYIDSLHSQVIDMSLNIIKSVANTL